MTPVTVASEPVLPGPIRPPDPAPTTTGVPVTPPEYHPNSYESVPSSTTAGRTVTSVEAAVRPTTTSTVSTTTTVARLNTTVAAAVGSCGAYPYTACIPPVGNRATWSCIIQHESGGNPAAVEPHSGAGGIFQFLGTTWRGLGYPGVAQAAAIATQIQAAAKLYQQSGFMPWVSDGCVR